MPIVLFGHSWGDFVNILMPYVNCYEQMKFGEYAVNTAMDGFEESPAAVMVLHSSDDATVLQEYGYDAYYARYMEEPRFKFIHFEDKGHNAIYYSEAGEAYIEAFNETFAEWGETLDYDYEDFANEERFIADKAEYIHQNLDREKWCNVIDEELFSEMANKE